MESVPRDGFCLAIQQWVVCLLHSASCFGQSVSKLIAGNVAMGGDPLEDQVGSVSELAELLPAVLGEPSSLPAHEALKERERQTIRNTVCGESGVSPASSSSVASSSAHAGIGSEIGGHSLPVGMDSRSSIRKVDQDTSPFAPHGILC